MKCRNAEHYRPPVGTSRHATLDSGELAKYHAVTSGREKLLEDDEPPSAVEAFQFLCWIIVFTSCCVNFIGTWIVFWLYVADNRTAMPRHQVFLLWFIWTIVSFQLRQYTIAKTTFLLRRVYDHMEVFFVSYMCTTFCANISFYLHTPSPILFDLGFVLIREYNEHSPWEIFRQILSMWLPTLMVATSMFWTRRERCQLLVDWFRLVAITFAFRALISALTTLPEPAPHCRSTSKNIGPPTGFVDIVTNLTPTNQCGGLLFSTHAAYTSTTLLLMLRRLDQKHSKANLLRCLRWLLGFIYIVALCVLEIAGRKHYTVDLILGVVIATLSFFNFEFGWGGERRAVWEMMDEQTELQEKEQQVEVLAGVFTADPSMMYDEYDESLKKRGVTDPYLSSDERLMDAAQVKELGAIEC